MLIMLTAVSLLSCKSSHKAHRIITPDIALVVESKPTHGNLEIDKKVVEANKEYTKIRHNDTGAH